MINNKDSSRFFYKDFNGLSGLFCKAVKENRVNYSLVFFVSWLFLLSTIFIVLLSILKAFSSTDFKK